MTSAWKRWIHGSAHTGKPTNKTHWMPQNPGPLQGRKVRAALKHNQEQRTRKTGRRFYRGQIPPMHVGSRHHRLTKTNCLNRRRRRNIVATACCCCCRPTSLLFASRRIYHSGPTCQGRLVNRCTRYIHQRSLYLVYLLRELHILVVQ